MMLTNHRVRGVAVLLAALALTLGAMIMAFTPSVRAAAASQKVLLVPDDGNSGTSQSWPTDGFPGTFAPSFTNATEDSIQNNSTDPIAAGAYDTVVLMQVTDLDTRMANATFKARLQNFVTNGGKLVIMPIGDNSSHQNLTYNQFFYPFTTAHAASINTLTQAEDNTLNSTNTASASYINNSVMFQSDSAKDGAELSSCDQNWYASQVAAVGAAIKGPLTAYAEYGSGLIVFLSYDNDVFGNTSDTNGGGGYTGSDAHEGTHLRRMWLNALKQPTNPDNLPRSVKVFGVSVNPATSTATPGSSVTFRAHVTNQTVAQSGKTVSFSVTAGPDAGKTGSGVTNATGDATFTFTTAGSGTDTIKATVVGGLDCGNATGTPVSGTAAATVAAPSPSPSASTVAVATQVPALPKAGRSAPAVGGWVTGSVIVVLVGAIVASLRGLRRD